MGSRTFSVVIGAGQTADLPRGRFFYVKEATAAITIEADIPGALARFESIGAGARFRSPERWRVLRVSSATAQTVVIVLAEDAEFDVANAVSVTGTASVSEAPSETLSDTAPVACASGALTQVVPASTTRKRVTLMVDPDFAPAAGYVYARRLAGAQNLLPMQPGVAYEFPTRAGIAVRNDTGTAATVYVLEET